MSEAYLEIIFGRVNYICKDQLHNRGGSDIDYVEEQLWHLHRLAALETGRSRGCQKSKF